MLSFTYQLTNCFYNYANIDSFYDSTIQIDVIIYYRKNIVVKE